MMYQEDTEPCFVSPTILADEFWGLLSKGSSKAPLKEEAIILHIYNYSWLTSVLNLPFFHVGVEVCETEVCFSQDGILLFCPGDYDPNNYRQPILLGHTKLTELEVRILLSELRPIWQGKDYDLFSNNCQTFAMHFCQRLGLARTEVPEEYLCFADLRLLRCCGARRLCAAGNVGRLWKHFIGPLLALLLALALLSALFVALRPRMHPGIRQALRATTQLHQPAHSVTMKP